MPKTTNPLLRRKSSTPKTPRKSSSQADIEDSSERLDDTGLVPSLAPQRVPQDVQSLIRHIHAHTGDDIPDRGAGMGSERISEVLRFRSALPKIVSLAHLHALSTSSTNTERELARLLGRGVVRKTVIPGRGKGGAAVGEGVVLVEDWKAAVRDAAAGVDDEVKEKYIALMDAHPASTTAPTSSLADDEVRQLVTAGFFTSPALLLSSKASDLFARPGSSSLLSSTLSQSFSTAPTGTLAAIGGYGAVHESGGGGSTLATSGSRSSATHLKQREMTFSLPATGAYLKLLTSARLHFLALLKQLSPRYKEATVDLLREKWDGNVANDAASRAKRARAEWTGVLPGKTKKWRDFYGLRFEWVLAECVGSGLVELFETGSVGMGVRAR